MVRELSAIVSALRDGGVRSVLEHERARLEEQHARPTEIG